MLKVGVKLMLIDTGGYRERWYVIKWSASKQVFKHCVF